MARPTINLESGDTIVADGAHNFTVQPGVPYIMTIDGNFNGGTLVFYYYNAASDSTVAVDGGSWTAKTEERFVSNHAVMSLELTGGSGAAAINVNFNPVNYSVK